MSLLEVEDLQVAVRGGLAVDGVSLRLARGEVLSLLGESGAGKSLTAAAIVGLLPHGSRMTSGRIVLDGQDVAEAAPAEWRRIRGKRICAVFQDPAGALDPLQTVGRQLAETIRAHHPQFHSTTLAERVGDWLDAVSLDAACASAYPHELTNSMRQRVTMALAMCPGPEVLIADEPATELDLPLRVQLTALLSRLARAQGTSVLLISRDLRTAMAAADRISVMYAGCIVETAAPAHLVEHPRHPYVAALLGSIPGIGERKKRLPAIAGRMPLPGSVPRGCVFRLSCSQATDQCRAERPAQPEAGPACFHPLPGPGDV